MKNPLKYVFLAVSFLNLYAATEPGGPPSWLSLLAAVGSFTAFVVINETEGS